MGGRGAGGAELQQLLGQAGEPVQVDLELGQDVLVLGHAANANHLPARPRVFSEIKLTRVRLRRNSGQLPKDAQVVARHDLVERHFLGVRHRAELYEGAVHGFTMSDTAAYDEAATERHWTNLLDLLTRAL